MAAAHVALVVSGGWCINVEPFREVSMALAVVAGGRGAGRWWVCSDGCGCGRAFFVGSG